jgi:hypothetical protein
VHEVIWLEALKRSGIPTTLVWGELDPIAPTAVADYVWQTCLRDRAVPAEYWRIPCANHYVQHDRPHIVAALLRARLEPASGVGDLHDAASRAESHFFRCSAVPRAGASCDVPFAPQMGPHWASYTLVGYSIIG